MSNEDKREPFKKPNDAQPKKSKSFTKPISFDRLKSFPLKVKKLAKLFAELLKDKELSKASIGQQLIYLASKVPEEQLDNDELRRIVASYGKTLGILTEIVVELGDLTAVTMIPPEIQKRIDDEITEENLGTACPLVIFALAIGSLSRADETPLGTGPSTP